MDLRYTTLDVFTDRPFGGNPLAVFCDQPAISDERMQTIAREFNLSETVFIVPSRDARALRRLRIFTPAHELPFAGHPTLGAVQTLVENGIAPIGDAGGTFALELEVGLVPIRVTRSKGERPFHQLTTARLPERLGHSPSSGDLAHILSLSANDIAQAPVEAWSCGVPFLFVPLRDRAALAKAKPNTGIWSERLKGAGTSSVFVFCTEPTLRARMFAPDLGIVEDPATGSAAAAFAGYLAARQPATTQTHQWVVEQGFEMGRPSILHIQADTEAGKVTAVRVGGTAVKISEGTLFGV
jgi:trans-2,3-dihydro-3-hydroxyanthranilate isomerase